MTRKVQAPSGRGRSPRRPSSLLLRQNEKKFRTLVEFLPVGVSVICRQRLVYINRAGVRLFGARRRGQMLGMKVFDLVPPERRAALATDLARQLTDLRPASLHEGTILRLDGTRLPVQVGGTPFEYNGVPATMHVFSDITERRQAEAQLRGMTAELEAANRSLREEIERRQALERQILEITEREQRRLGRDLHDGLGQHLVGIRFVAESLRRDVAGLGKDAERLAARLVEESQKAITHARSIARGLHPVEADGAGLMLALRALADSVTGLFLIPCQFDCPRDVPVLDYHAATHLYRIVQEAVTNAVRHAQANHLWIRLRLARGRIQLSVEDDGRGLPIPSRRPKGLGLATMQHRASLLGATYRIGARRGGGTRLALAWSPGPLPADGKSRVCACGLRQVEPPGTSGARVPVSQGAV